MAAGTTTVQVSITGVEPISRFIALACEADKSFRALTLEKVEALPALAAQGVMSLQGALRLLQDNGLVITEAR